MQTSTRITHAFLPSFLIVIAICIFIIKPVSNYPSLAIKVAGGVCAFAQTLILVRTGMSSDSRSS